MRSAVPDARRACGRAGASTCDNPPLHRAKKTEGQVQVLVARAIGARAEAKGWFATSFEIGHADGTVDQARGLPRHEHGIAKIPNPRSARLGIGVGDHLAQRILAGMPRCHQAWASCCVISTPTDQEETRRRFRKDLRSCTDSPAPPRGFTRRSPDAGRTTGSPILLPASFGGTAIGRVGAPIHDARSVRRQLLDPGREGADRRNRRGRTQERGEEAVIASARGTSWLSERRTR